MVGLGYLLPKAETDDCTAAWMEYRNGTKLHVNQAHCSFTALMYNASPLLGYGTIQKHHT
jgi:hypothetical protein